MLICRATELRREPNKRPQRTGKTAKDRKAGAQQANYANKQARAEWQKDPRATNASFPG